MQKLLLTLVLLVFAGIPASHCAELKERFSYGINYAWKNYAADFGGISSWMKSGVADNPGVYAEELNDMADHGIKVVRWWVWPEFWTDAISFDEDGAPLPLGQQAVIDGLKALELANAAGIRIMFCLFSFDGFRETRDAYGIRMTGYRDIVVDDAKRAALMTNVVSPFARALQRSVHFDSLHSWDVINEPEWAVGGKNKYGGAHGGDSFEPNSDLEVVSHDQMEQFIADTIAVLHRETPDIPVSVGSAALKWATAWSRLDLDFYQTHIYDWVNDYWPYHLSPEEAGLGDKPLIMGEYPVEGLDAVEHKVMLQSWYSNGYAGALGWDYRVTRSPGQTQTALARKRDVYLDEFDSFAENISARDTVAGQPLLDVANAAMLSKPKRTTTVLE